jgi:Tol biopolymer transport system component
MESRRISVVAAVVVVGFALVLPAAASRQRQNAGIVWAQAYAILGAHADGSHRHRITDYDGGIVPDNFASPVWSPAGRKLAYNNCDSGVCVIHLFRYSGRNETLLRLGGANNPTWSPDGLELAFQATSHSASLFTGIGISAFSLASRRWREITPPRRYRFDDDPAWSPDGATIAFVRFVREPVIYFVGAYGGPARWLTRGESPSWAPGGSRLVFAFGDGIYTIEPSGRGRTRIARIPGTRGADLQPRWSPDGRKILFTTTPHGRRPGIWVMDVDGSDRRRIITVPTHGSSNFYGANWQPG